MVKYVKIKKKDKVVSTSRIFYTEAQFWLRKTFVTVH